MLLLGNEIYAQVDTSFIDKLPNKRTIQFHTTLRNFDVSVRQNGEQLRIFQNNNLTSGLYLKRGIFEVFFSLPLNTFNDSSINSESVIATGFAVNFYPQKYHVQYDLRYVQGYEDLDGISEQVSQILDSNNRFIFNRLNLQYIQNSNVFSLKSALRFTDIQRKSAGSFIIALPIAYHLAYVDNFELSPDEPILDSDFQRFSFGASIGYGYTLVVDRWAISSIFNGGFDLRNTRFRSVARARSSRTYLVPNVNYVASSVYNFDKYFIGIVYDYFPEFNLRNDLDVRIQNWKLRLYAGRRFGGD